MTLKCPSVSIRQLKLHAQFHLDPSNRLATIRGYTQDRQTDRQDRTGNGPIAQGKPFLRSVAQKQYSVIVMLAIGVVQQYLMVFVSRSNRNNEFDNDKMTTNILLLMAQFLHLVHLLYLRVTQRTTFEPLRIIWYSVM